MARPAPGRTPPKVSRPPRSAGKVNALPGRARRAVGRHAASPGRPASAPAPPGQRAHPSGNEERLRQRRVMHIRCTREPETAGNRRKQPGTFSQASQRRRRKAPSLSRFAYRRSGVRLPLAPPVNTQVNTDHSGRPLTRAGGRCTFSAHHPSVRCFLLVLRSAAARLSPMPLATSSRRSGNRCP